MRVLFVSSELIAGDLAYRLKKEGCEVKLFIGDKSRKDCFENMVKKTNNWQKELSWVGKKGLIVFDDVDYGKMQDKLRKRGFLVVGGNEVSDNLERDRGFGQEIFEKYKVGNVLKTINFSNIKLAINFVKKNPNFWVLKQNGHLGVLNYIGSLSDGSDVLDTLKNYDRQKLGKIISVSLQRRVFGVEIGVARYFNGRDWVGPVEFNVEHKRFLNGDLGPLTAEMGTVMWYENNEKNKLFQKTLARIKPFLQQINFKGDVDINCIIKENNCYPLELTTRFGSPAIHLQMGIHQTFWKDFLMAIAKGEKIKFNYKKGFGVVVCVAVPPFPYLAYSKAYNNFYAKGTKILFKNKLTKTEWDRIHFEEVSKKNNEFYIAGSNGYILYVNGFGSTIEKAQKQAYNLVKKIVIPKMLYRTDIGDQFNIKNQKKLKHWGWIS